jgi:hypothetical protein
MVMYYEPSCECFECMEKENRIDDIKYWFRAVLDQLFGLEEFDAEQLERCTEELACYLDMKIPSQPLAVVRKNRMVDMAPVLEAWKQSSIQYLQNLANTGT